ncbi:leader peptidase (prepilin peptidase)/N-methyltransferase [Sphingomonas zeicaulis]|uniref:prepilin peptidase n=1 Tax=Sphingomonas zeicaulis TaxID=1632740 RepID=UPI003D223E62
MAAFEPIEPMLGIAAPAWAALGAGLGLVAGSFLATLAVRWPEGRGIAIGRSTCDACGQPLRWFELVPLLSFAAQRGRCRRCGGRIDARHPLIEVAAALIGAAAMIAAPGLAGLAGALFGWLLLTLATLDVEHHWLPDRLTIPLAAAGIAVGAAGVSPTLVNRLIGAFAGFGTLWLIATAYRVLRGRIGLGGGDPKLFGAIGAWLGWQMLPFVLLLAALAGLAAVVAMRLRGATVTGTTRLPFGALLAVAAFPVWLVTAAS